MTPVADHYVVDINIINPDVDVSTWRLAVSGLVDSPFELDFEQLQSDFPVVEEYSVLTCISNEVGGPLVGNSAWRGVRLKGPSGAGGSDRNRGRCSLHMCRRL